jgi:hypothetical protein
MSMLEDLKAKEQRDVADAQKVVDEATDNYADVRARLEEALAEGKDVTALKEEEANAIEVLTASQEGLAAVQNHYKTSVKELEEATLAAAGKLDSMAADDK